MTKLNYSRTPDRVLESSTFINTPHTINIHRDPSIILQSHNFHLTKPPPTHSPTTHQTSTTTLTHHSPKSPPNAMAPPTPSKNQVNAPLPSFSPHCPLPPPFLNKHSLTTLPTPDPPRKSPRRARSQEVQARGDQDASHGGVGEGEGEEEGCEVESREDTRRNGEGRGGIGRALMGGLD